MRRRKFGQQNSPYLERGSSFSPCPTSVFPLQVYPQGLFEQEPVSAGPLEQEPVSAGPLEQGLVSVPVVGLEQRGDPGILSATLHPGHYGVVHKNSGRSVDLPGVLANRDTLA